MIDIYSANPVDLAILKMLDDMRGISKPEGARFYYQDFVKTTRFKLFAITALEEINFNRAYLFFDDIGLGQWCSFFINDFSKYPYLMSQRLHNIRYLKSAKCNYWATIYECLRLFAIDKSLIQSGDYCTKEQLPEWLESQLKLYPANQSILPKTSVAKPFTERPAERVKWVSYVDPAPENEHNKNPNLFSDTDQGYYE